MKNKLLLAAFFPFLYIVGFTQGARSIESIGITDVIVIELAGNGDVWAGSASQGVAFYQADSSRWSYFDSLNVPELKSNHITSIEIGVVGTTPHSYIGTASGGVITQAGPWDTIANVAGLLVNGLAYRPDSLWVIAGGNIIRYDSSFNHIQNYALAHPAVTCVERGSNAACAGFWYGTVNSGAFFTSNGLNMTDSINSTAGGGQLVNNHVNALAIDQNCDRVFIGTQGGFGVCPTNGPPCQNFTTANGLPQNNVTAVVLGCNGNVWLGTSDSGVVVFNTTSSQFTRVTTASNNVTALACSQNCITYVGAKDGSITQVDSAKNVIGVMTGVKNMHRDVFAVNVFPQPAGSQINFSFETEITNGELLLTDISGRTIEYLPVKNTNQITADVSSLSNGIYFYQLYSNKQLVKTGKVDVVR